MIILKSAKELEKMRQAGRIVAEVLALIWEQVAPGVTTAELNRLADEWIRRRNAVPSFKGYPNSRSDGPPFPASICASINEELVHGIPGHRKLGEGDIVSIDVGAIYQGYHGDVAVTLPVSQISPEAQALLEATEGSLYAGIAAARAGRRTGDISAAIQAYAEERGFNVIREYTGHGIGRNMHEDPQVPNFGEKGRGVKLRPGMTIALEPMVCQGDWHTQVLEDHWTVVTQDGKLTAHFEHTIVVTNGEAEILTRL